MIPRRPTPTLFPYTTLFRSRRGLEIGGKSKDRDGAACKDEPECQRFRARDDPARKRWHSGSRSEEHTSELQSLRHLVCRLLLEKKKNMAAATSLVAPTRPAQ